MGYPSVSEVLTRADAGRSGPMRESSCGRACVCVRSRLSAITRTRSQRCSCMAPAAYRTCARTHSGARVKIPRSTAVLWLAALQGSLLPATERLATHALRARPCGSVTSDRSV